MRRALIGIQSIYIVNVIAALTIGVGLLNSSLILLIYGTSKLSDIWMLSLALTQSLILLSQLGVEQYPIFRADHHSISAQEGIAFERESVTWSLLFGVCFAALLSQVIPGVVGLFATGFTNIEKNNVGEVVTPLLLQVMLSPTLYLMRQELLMSGRTKMAFGVNALFPIVQLVALVTGWLFGIESPTLLASFIAIGSVTGFIITATITGINLYTTFSIPTWKRIAPLAKASFGLRATHSVHNFVLVLLTNSALSGGPPGSLAFFQLIRKISDGVSSICVGPHLQLYHARQALAWSSRDHELFKKNITTYVTQAMPIMGALLVTIVCVSFILTDTKIGSIEVSTDSIWLLTVFWAWQILVAIETIPVSILIVSKNSRLLLVINICFISMFYLLTANDYSQPCTGESVALYTFSCQIISSILFTFAAYKVYSYRFNY
jgi:hypothetical protein